MTKKKKKYNKYTKGYKIDIFASEEGKNHYLYVGSTDMCKTCKDARRKYKIMNPTFCINKDIKANFDYETRQEYNRKDSYLVRR